MDKKRLVKNLTPEELKGFEEFIDGESVDTDFLQRGPQKKDASYEHFTFLTNDSERLIRQKELLKNKLSFVTKYDQGEKLIQDQQKEIFLLKKNIFEISNKPGTPYMKSIKEIFDSIFAPPQV